MNNFAVLTISYRHFTNASLIINTTDTPCHLTCYYTAEKPGRHKTTLTRRGVTLPWGAYFCFVAWKSVEQSEVGDSLTHTFAIPDWQLGQTLWLAFRGTVSGVLSPSTSPVFEHLHPGQDIILNPYFLNWPAAQAIPTYWEKITAIGSEADPVKDYDIKLIGSFTPRTFIDRFGHAVGLRQSLDITGLAGLTVTISAQMRGLDSHANGIGTGVWNDRYRYYDEDLTLYYQWEKLSHTIPLPATLSGLFVQNTIRFVSPMIDIYGWIDDWQIALG